MDKAHRYFVINKPYNMVSQFVSSHPVNLLCDLAFEFPRGTHAIGRLDSNSEGLLLLTTNKKVTRLLFSGEQAHNRVYLVQVNNVLSAEKLETLNSGVSIRIKGGEFYTAACKAEIVVNPEQKYHGANRSGEFGEHTWVLITLTEGKFRQVRKMIAALRHRCKRLIRISIEDLELGDLKPGEVRELGEMDFFQKLRIDY